MSAHKAMDGIALRIELKHSKSADKDMLIDKLFADLTLSEDGAPTWRGQTFEYCKNTRLKQKLLALFGSTISLETVDANIALLIREQNGYLQTSEDNVVVLSEGVLSCEIEQLCSLICQSLSHDLVSIVRTLIRNLSEIVSSREYISKTERIDVNVFETLGNELIVIHVRFESEIAEKKQSFCFFGRSKKQMRLKLSLRRIGITSAYCQRLLVVTPERSVRTLAAAPT